MILTKIFKDKSPKYNKDKPKQYLHVLFHTQPAKPCSFRQLTWTDKAGPGVFHFPRLTHDHAALWPTRLHLSSNQLHLTLRS